MSSAWYNDDENAPEVLSGWFIHKMDKSFLSSFVDDCFSEKEEKSEQDEPFDRASVERIINNTLIKFENEKTTDTPFRFRLARESDVEAICQLIQAIADFENVPNAVELSRDDIIRDGFSDNPIFYCILLDYVEENGEIKNNCGMIFFYFGYTMGTGRYIYMAELFVKEGYRRKGGGELCLKLLSGITLATDCTELTWIAYDWNALALGFYKKMGAKIDDDMTLVKYGAEGLVPVSNFAK